MSRKAIVQIESNGTSEPEALGVPVRVGIGNEERELMTLYPQPRGRK